MRKFNFFERMALLNIYKPKLMLDFFGFILFQSLLSAHQLWWGLAVLIASFIAGMIAARKQDIQAFADTNIGKAMLTQAKPVNIIAYIIGIAILSYGSWLDSYLILIAGGSIAFASSVLHLKFYLPLSGK
jgi:hypothetical protein